MLHGLKQAVSCLFHSPRRLLFDHLPKCAGTTVGAYLQSQYPRKLTFQTDGADSMKSVRQFLALPEKQRYRYRLIAGHHAHQLLDDVDPTTLAMTILRDPVDRIVSHYYYVKRHVDHYLHRLVVGNAVSLEDYVTLDLSTWQGSELSNWYTTHYSGWTLEQALARPDAAIERAYTVVTERYDIIGFQDGLPEAMSAVMRAAGLNASFENVFLNKTIGRERLNEVSDFAKDRIADANELDIELYQRLSGLCHRRPAVRRLTRLERSTPALLGG